MIKSKAVGIFESGQALSEFMVSLAVIIPLFLLIPVVANYLDVQTATHEASRYVAWERTVYDDLSQVPDGIENSVQERFIERESSGFSDATQVDQHERWKDYGSVGHATIVDTGAGVAVRSERIAMNINDPVANSSIDAIQAMDPNALGMTSVSIPLSSDGSLLGTFSAGPSFLTAERSSRSAPMDEVAGSSRFHTKASAVLLADGGVLPRNEEEYTSITNEIVSTDGGRLEAWQTPLRILNFITLGFFDELEILDSDRNAVSDEQSLILPDGLIQN
ncbi:MAG: hypothetical protein MI867_10465 [Pseudomonadales bacterium]|nr:hypothetical protein [Pseudomonadales bacterium]